MRPAQNPRRFTCRTGGVEPAQDQSERDLVDDGRVAKAQRGERELAGGRHIEGDAHRACCGDLSRASDRGQRDLGLQQPDLC